MNMISEVTRETATARDLPTPGGDTAIQVRLMANASVARFHGKELDRADLRVPGDEIPTPAALTDWVRNGGLWAKAVRIAWRQLVALDTSKPIIVLLNDGSVALLVRDDKKQNLVWLRHPSLPSTNRRSPSPKRDCPASGAGRSC